MQELRELKQLDHDVKRLDHEGKKLEHDSRKLDRDSHRGYDSIGGGYAADSTPFLANSAQQSSKKQTKITAVDYDLAKKGINEMQSETGYFALLARQAVAKVDIIHQGTFSKNATGNSTIGAIMSSVGSWKTRNYRISKNQQLEYIDPSDGEVKGFVSLAVVQFECGPLANVTNSGYGGHTAFALNVKDMLSTPPTTLELVFNNQNDAKTFAVAVNFVADETNIKSFCKVAGWDPTFLTSFSPRLAKKSHVLCRTACCFANCSLTKCNWDSLGSADFCYCCCLQFFGQCGVSRTAKALHNANLKAILKEDNDEVKDCMTMCGTMCDAAETVAAEVRHHRLAEEVVTDDIDVNPLIIDFKSNSCCCYMCDIPFWQIRLRDLGCKYESTHCCFDLRCAIPPDNSVPCEIALCGFFCIRYRG